MADQACSAPVLSDIASKDTNRIVGTVAKVLAANSPYINILDGGTFKSGVSDVVRSVVQMPAAPGDLAAIPTFTNDVDICGETGAQDLTGTVDFTYQLGSKRGKGPKVCVKQGFSAFRTSYSAAEDSLAKQITQYINADTRGQLYEKSGTKFVVADGFCFEDLLTGGSESDIGVKFAPVTPDSVLTFKAIWALADWLSEEVFADMFPAGDKGMPHYRLITSSKNLEHLRSEAGVNNVLTTLTQGGFRLGEVALKSYSFEQSPAYRGIAFAKDQTPLRASGFNQDGTLALVNPKVVVVTDVAKNQAYAKVNPAWKTAAYDVSLLVAPGAFRRLVPERYVGEGSFRFSPQLHMGELDWFYSKDCSNPYGDFGWHQYQITRAYEPVRPHFIIPILSKRCDLDLGATPCPVTTCTPYTGGVL